MSQVELVSQKSAREAFVEKDLELSKGVHEYRLHSGETHKSSGKYIKSVVYGGLDGVITTFASVSAIAGAGLAVGVIIIVGLANLFADGISMGLGDYLSSVAEREFEKMERKREEWECENYLEGEKQEMVQLYVGKGLPQEDAEQVVDILSKHKSTFVDVMMVEELGIMPPDEDDAPWKDGLVTFFSFCFFGAIPLIAYIIKLASASKVSDNIVFLIACLLTAATLFFLGALTSKVTVESWWKAGSKTLFLGACAAAVAYLIGYLLGAVATLESSH